MQKLAARQLGREGGQHQRRKRMLAGQACPLLPRAGAVQSILADIEAC